MNYWINTISREHVQVGVEGGFTQANHGSPRNLQKMDRGDWLVFYSPKTKLKDGAPLQQFTASGRIMDDEPYQVEVSMEFKPFRRKVDFFGCTEASIRPLLEELNFIEDKRYWGFPFRHGLFTIERDDFILIARAMDVAPGIAPDKAPGIAPGNLEAAS